MVITQEGVLGDKADAPFNTNKLFIELVDFFLFRPSSFILVAVILTISSKYTNQIFTSVNNFFVRSNKL